MQWRPEPKRRTRIKTPRRQRDSLPQTPDQRSSQFSKNDSTTRSQTSISHAASDYLTTASINPWREAHQTPSNPMAVPKGDNLSHLTVHNMTASNKKLNSTHLPLHKTSTTTAAEAPPQTKWKCRTKHERASTDKPEKRDSEPKWERNTTMESWRRGEPGEKSACEK